MKPSPRVLLDIMRRLYNVFSYIECVAYRKCSLDTIYSRASTHSHARTHARAPSRTRAHTAGVGHVPVMHLGPGSVQVGEGSGGIAGGGDRDGVLHGERVTRAADRNGKKHEDELMVAASRGLSRGGGGGGGGGRRRRREEEEEEGGGVGGDGGGGGCPLTIEPLGSGFQGMGDGCDGGGAGWVGGNVWGRA